MSYILGQYNYNNSEKEWIAPLSFDANIKTISNSVDIGTGNNSSISFEDIALKFDGVLSMGSTYYCHCKIKRIKTVQDFTLKLIDFEGTQESPEQFIKTIKIFGAESDEWVDVQFTFTPQAEIFDTIVFNLTRISEDFIQEKRNSFIVFLEFGEVQNILIEMSNNKPLIKMGIQSRPGLKMMINQEEISIGRTGIYEIKNGEIKINYFSLVNSAINKTNEELNELVKDEENKRAVSLISDTPKVRTFESFTLDYIYEE